MIIDYSSYRLADEIVRSANTNNMSSPLALLTMSFQVDTQKVAEVRGYKNHRSVQNRLNTLKKKYDLPFGSSSKSAGEGSKKASDAAGPNQPAVPHTPSKERVKKAKARTPLTSSRKPTTSKAKGKGKAQNAVKKEEGRQDDESSDEELVVESPKFENISDDEAVFGKKDTDEETFDENV